MKDPEGFMSVAAFERLCDEAKGHIPTAILFWRGESILHPQFRHMVKYARARFKRLEIATNTEKWRDEDIDLVCLFDFLSISVHSKRALEFARNAIVLRQGHGKIQLTAVEGERTAKSLMELARHVDRIKIYNQHSLGGVWGATDKKRSRRASASSCPRLTRDLIIAWNGYMSRCTHVWETSKRANAFGLGLRKSWERALNTPWPHCKRCDQDESQTKGETIVPSAGE
jgi:hypothetical protein